MVSLVGKTVVVTGATGGLGLQAALALAAAGELVFIGRNHAVPGVILSAKEQRRRRGTFAARIDCESTRQAAPSAILDGSRAHQVRIMLMRRSAIYRLGQK